MKQNTAASPARTTPAVKPERLKARHAKKLMLEMLRKYPIVEAACAKVGISRSTHYEWIKKDAQYSSDVEQATRASIDTVTDIAESNIIEGIKKGDYKCSAFWLTHRHMNYKKRNDLEDSKIEKLLIKPPPSERFIAAVRKYNPDYNPPREVEYITREELERERRNSEIFSRLLEERFGSDRKGIKGGSISER
jgi:hypothetical protein